jgi:hypothetical protein
MLAALVPQLQTAERPRLEPVDYRLAISFDYPKETMHGTARLEVINRDRVPVSEISLLLYRMLRVERADDGEDRRLRFTQEVVSFEDFPQLQVNHVRVTLLHRLRPGDTATIGVRYAGYLLGYSETGMRYIQDRIDPGFTILRPDAFTYPEIGYPSFAANQGVGNRAFHYEILVTVPDSLRVANGGRLVEVTRANGLATYRYRDIRPAWRMDVAIAPYGRLVQGGSSVFYLPGDSIGGVRVLHALQTSMTLFRDWMGPLVGDTGFSVIEIPDGWGSQADRTAIIQTAAAFRDAGRVREVYHEVSHQWNAGSTDSAPSRWEEGLAMFLESAAVTAIDSTVDDSLIPRMVDRLRSRYREHPEQRSIPMIDYGRRRVTGLSYLSGAVMFSLLDQLLGRRALGELLGTFYRRFAVAGASTREFAHYAVDHGGSPVCALLRDWLFTVEGWRKLDAGIPPDDLIRAYHDTTECRLE